MFIGTALELKPEINSGASPVARVSFSQVPVVPVQVSVIVPDHFVNRIPTQAAVRAAARSATEAARVIANSESAARIAARNAERTVKRTGSIASKQTNVHN